MTGVHQPQPPTAPHHRRVGVGVVCMAAANAADQVRCQASPAPGLVAGAHPSHPSASARLSKAFTHMPRLTATISPNRCGSRTGACSTYANCAARETPAFSDVPRHRLGRKVAVEETLDGGGLPLECPSIEEDLCRLVSCHSIKQLKKGPLGLRQRELPGGHDAKPS